MPTTETGQIASAHETTQWIQHNQVFFLSTGFTDWKKRAKN